MAKNCSLDLVFGTLLTTTSAILGPDPTVSTEYGGFSSSLNIFLVIVMDAGGGKSIVFMTDRLQDLHGSKLELESYTSAGLQRHMADTSGYALLTSDEGQTTFSIEIEKLKSKHCIMLYTTPPSPHHTNPTPPTPPNTHTPNSNKNDNVPI